jgi:hypothetical protein
VGGDQYRALVQHFFRTLFDFGILSDVGAESFKRALLGAVAVALGLGFLLVRIFLGKYAYLATASASEYQSSLAADHTFLMAWPMWLVAVAVVLVGHSLFPDETDFRILMVQPISRARVFAAKLSALLLFISLIVVAMHVALLPMISVTLVNPHARAGFLAALPVYLAASVTASAFAAVAVVAIHGSIVLLVPREGLVAFSAALRSALLCALVLVVPMIAVLPGMAGSFAAQATWLGSVPPVWFVGLERWWLGDGSQGAFAARAALALSAAAVIAVTAYVILYRRFDRVSVRSSSARRQKAPRWIATDLSSGRAVFTAVARFTAMTLRRSVLHQGIVVAFLAAGLGFVLITLLAAEIPFVFQMSARERYLAVWSAVWALCGWMFMAVPAIRLALSVPIETRANWVFRMTETPRHRAWAIGAAVTVVWRLGVAIPVMVVGPVLWILAGTLALKIAMFALVAGWLLVEIQMRDWQRIPFTCSYLPGKGFMPQVFVRTVGTFLIGTSVMTGLIRMSVARASVAAVVLAVTAGAAALLLFRRRRRSLDVALIFEDELPNEVNVLRLTGG